VLLQYTGFKPVPIRTTTTASILLVFLSLCVAAGVSAQGTEDAKAEIARATALRDKGALQQARSIYESLLPQLRAQPPGLELGETLIGLGQIATAEGHYENAISLALESAAIFHQLGSADGEARAYNDAGFAYMNAGNYPEAARNLEVALHLSDENRLTKTPVIALNNLGNVYYYEAKYSEAFRSYNNALERAGPYLTEPWAVYWKRITLLNLATLYQRIGNDQSALAMYKTIEQSAADASQAFLGHLYANVGVLYRHLGDPEKALDAYGKAEHAYAQQHDVDGELGVLKNTGIVLALNLGRFPQALNTFTKARELALKSNNKREAMQALLYRAQTLYQMERLAQAKEQFQAALNEAAALGTVEEQWKALYALGRIAEDEGQSGAAEVQYRNAIAKIESVRSKIQLSLLKTDFLADKRDVYDGMIRLLLARNDAAAAFEYMERSRARVFQDRFYSGKGQSASVTLQGLQARLDDSTALVEFWIANGAIAALWITKEAEGITQRQLAPEQMESLTRTISDFPESLGENWQAETEKLNRLMPLDIPPFTGARYTHVVIVPDGLLSLLPLELLSAGSTGPLLEHRDLSYVPSAVLLMRAPMIEAARLQLPWRQELIAFGDPVVAAQKGDLLAVERQGEGALPGSEVEIREISKMSAGKRRIYTGAADRKNSFIEALHPGAALLHISTHAVADMDNPERSRLLFSPDTDGEPNDYVFLKELYDMDLRGVSLATLSACDTEKGKLVPGEGIQAFSRALLAAGSRSAVTTLWRVPDQPTAEFMQHFYYYLLKKHKAKDEALRLAKLDFLHSGTQLSHPRYWAAFVLNGDGASPVPRFISWGELLLPVPVVVLAGILIWQMRRREASNRSKMRAAP
jgi:CHAT domain-containing protein